LKRLGDVFGEMGIIDGSPRSATITARRSSLVISLDDTALGALGETSKIFMQAVMYRVFAEVMAVRLRQANEEIASLNEKLGEYKEQA
jgi:CRP-like cAMP-binding protein